MKISFVTAFPMTLHLRLSLLLHISNTTHVFFHTSIDIREVWVGLPTNAVSSLEIVNKVAVVRLLIQLCDWPWLRLLGIIWRRLTAVWLSVRAIQEHRLNRHCSHNRGKLPIQPSTRISQQGEPTHRNHHDWQIAPILKRGCPSVTSSAIGHPWPCTLVTAL